MILLQSIPTPSKGLFEGLINFFSSFGFAEGILILLFMSFLFIGLVWFMHHMRVKREGYKNNYDDLYDDLETLKLKHIDDLLEMERDHQRKLLNYKEDYINDIHQIIENNKNTAQEIIDKISVLIESITKEYIDLTKEIIEDKNRKINELTFLNQQLQEKIDEHS